MSPKDIRYIVLHCSATAISHNYTLAQLMRDHHRRGFKGIGYHFYVRRSGEVVPCRPLDEAGAHIYGFNHCSWGVCYEGGLDDNALPDDTRTPEQRTALRLLLQRLRHYAPQAQILGHRDLSPDLNKDGKISPNEWIKLCPCFDARSEYADI